MNKITWSTGHLQTLDSYVWNLSDQRKYNQLASRCAALEAAHLDWSEEQIEALAFREVFPELTLPPQFEPKP